MSINIIDEIYNVDERRKKLVKFEEGLDPNYVPQKLIHRNSEIKAVASEILPIIHNDPTKDIIVNGLRGTGKSAVVKHVRREVFPALCKKYNISKVPIIIYLECEGVSEYGILLDILKHLNIEAPRRLCNVSKLYGILKDELNKRKENIFVVFDEFDKMKKGVNDKVLKKFSQMRYFNFLIIINDLSCISYLSGYVETRLRKEEIKFSRYNKTQIIDIIKQRIDLTLNYNPLSDPALGVIGDFSEGDGDARYAIKLYNHCVNLAVEKKVINPSDVKHAKVMLDTKEMEDQVLLFPERHLQILKCYINNQLKSHTTSALYKEFRKTEGYRMVEYKQYYNYLRDLAEVGILRQIQGRGDSGRGRADSWHLDPRIDKENLRNIVEKKLESWEMSEGYEKKEEYTVPTLDG